MARVFDLFGAELLATLSSDNDIYQDQELTGYGLNLAWRNVVSEAAGNRIVMERAIAYFPKERVRGFLGQKISQHELLSDAVIFAVEEDGPLQLVSYRPQEIRADFRPAIRVDNLPAEKPTSSSAARLKDTPAKTDQVGERAKTDVAKLKQPSQAPDDTPAVVETPAMVKAPTVIDGDSAPVAPKSAVPPAVAPSPETRPVRPLVREQLVTKPGGDAGAQVDQPAIENHLDVSRKTAQSVAVPSVAEAGKSPAAEARARESIVPSARASKAPALKAHEPVMSLPTPSMTPQEPARTAPGREATKAKPAEVAPKSESARLAPEIALERPTTKATFEARTREAIGQSAPPPAIATNRTTPNDAKTLPSVAGTTKAESRPAAVKPRLVEIPGRPSQSTQTEEVPPAVSEPTPSKMMPERETTMPLASSTRVEPERGAPRLAAPDVSSPPEKAVDEKIAGERIAFLPTKPSEALPEIKPLVRPAPRALEGFIVQLAFDEKAKAQRWAEIMEQRGYAVSITEAGAGGALRVRLGNFAQRDEAERQLRTFKQEGLNGIVISLPQGFRPEAHSSVP